MSNEKTQIEIEKNFTASLITALSVLSYTPTRQQIQEKAEELSKIFDYKGSLENSIDEACYAVDSRMGLGISLVDDKADHDEDWVYNRKIEWSYSEAYEKFLKSQKWAPTIVRSLSDVGEKILGHLQDPVSEGSWDRRGLVIGHVQSGKTANYLGVITKAADAGYKFIVVIAGIHNNLRRQTQERVDEGFVGRSSDPAGRKKIGVGLGNKNYRYPATLTNVYQDFNKDTANRSGWSINDFSKPIVLVIKKNLSTLSSLHRWLRELNVTGNGQITDVPMLMIDDEADNASINTNKPDLDPTRTNYMIREILSLFGKSCYVGYTATPFANIFINPEAYDDQVREDLFPRDFIYCLDAPNTYFGPEKVFLDDESSDRILQPIRDAENYIPLSHKKDDEIPDLPPSLYKAIVEFVIIKSIRGLRRQKNEHCSMMVNVSRFVNIQGKVRDLISEYVKKLKEAIKANYAMPEKVSAKNKYMLYIYEIYKTDFSNCGFEWTDVKLALFDASESLRIFVVNSNSDEALNYKKYESGGSAGLHALAIGGLSLSRGLTIEGLCVSYLYRNTRMYDTLLQMGRWFGYRQGYEDLCRVHLSIDSIDWYAHIAQSADDLREQIKQMRRDGLSPERFGLYVRSHPDSLLVTAVNKMRSGETITVKQNFSGRLLESYMLPIDEKTNSANRKLLKKYWKSGFGKGKGALKRMKKGRIIRDVSNEKVGDFLLSFQTHSEFAERRSAAVTYLKSISDIYPLVDILLISLGENTEHDKKYNLRPQLRKSATKHQNFWRLSKDRVASRGDEKFGLTDQEKASAVELAAESGKKPSDFHYRSIRDKPLLMIHSLDLGSGASRQTDVPAFGISFPPGNYSEGIEIVANPIWVNQLRIGAFDMPDDEEDFDE